MTPPAGIDSRSCPMCGVRMARAELDPHLRRQHLGRRWGRVRMWGWLVCRPGVWRHVWGQLSPRGRLLTWAWFAGLAMAVCMVAGWPWQWFAVGSVAFVGAGLFAAGPQR